MSSLRYYLVVGGHDDDPDPLKAGRVRLRDLSYHGQKVKDKDLPFSQSLSTGSGDGRDVFNRPPPPGTIVVGYVPDGAEHTGYVHIVGTCVGINKSGGKEIPGNISLPFIDKARSIVEQIRIPPEIKDKTESNRSGIEKFTKEIQEKGEKFSLKLLDELVSHGATYEMAGIRNTPLQNITTAIDQGLSVLNSGMLQSMLDQLSVQIFNINSVLSTIKSQLPSNLQVAADNLMKMMPNDLGGSMPGSGASMGNLVNLDKLLEMFEDDIKNIKNISDLMNFIQNVSNSSYLSSSLNGLQGITMKVQTFFGEIEMILNADGSIENVLNEAIEQAKNLFSQGIQQIPGADSGKQLFTEDGTPIPNLVERFVDQSKVQVLQRFLNDLKTETNDAKRKGRETGPTQALAACTRLVKTDTFFDAFGNKIKFTSKVTEENRS